MDKIYSRRRIRLPIFVFHNQSPDNKKKRKIIKIILIFVIAAITVNYCLRSVTPVFDRMCEMEAKSIATKISNDKATEVMKNYKYEDLITISKDDKGGITGIKSNVIPINEIISDVAVKIQNELDKRDKNDIGISLGTFTGSKILSGRGPKVNIRISSMGDVETDFRSEFKEAGINQTLHRLYLQVVCRVSILTPFNTIQSEITNQVVIAENVIVGMVPTTYYNLEGLNRQTDALEVVQ